MADQQVVDQEVNTDQLRQEILSEKKGVPEGGKKPWELRMEQDHPEMKEQEDVEARVKPKKENIELQEVDEKPDEVEKPDSEKQPAETESQPDDQPDKEAQPVDAKKDTAQEEDAYIAEYAKKSGMDIAQAKEEVTSLRAISAKYGNDPVKIAKAYREMQSAYDKQKVTASSNVNPAVAQIAANPRSYAVGEVKKNSEKLIAEFREQNPARSRDMDDEQITEEIVDRFTFAVKDQIRGYEIKLKQEASSRREQYYTGMEEKDRRFLPEIKEALDKFPDWQVVGPEFRFQDMIAWAKGRSVDRLVKEAEDRIHKQYESKDRKIVGEISKAPQTTKVKQAVEQSKAAGLSKWQKDQALQMFASAPMDDEDKYAAYIEITQKNKKK